MKKNLKIFFTLLLIVCIIGSFPIIRDRVNQEQSNNIYQIALNHSSIKEISRQEDREEYYEKLKDVEADTIAFENLSVRDLSSYRDIKYITIETYLKEMEEFNYEINDLIDKYASRYYFLVMVNKNDFLEEEIEIIKNHFENYDMKEEDNDLFIYVDEPIEIIYKEKKTPNSLLTDKFLVDQRSMKEAVEFGMKPMLNIINQKNTSIQESLYSQIEYLIDAYNIDKVQVGQEMIGTPKNVGEFLELFQEKNVLVVSTEFETTKGLNTYIKHGQEDLVRGHEINIKNLELNGTEFAERIARGVKERNMRVILLSDFIDYRSQEAIETTSNLLIEDIKLTKNMLLDYSLGYATNFDEIKDYNTQELIAGIGFASVVALLALSFFNKEKQTIMLSVALFILSIGAVFVILKSNNTTLIKLYALSASILGACASILVPFKLETSSISIRYIYACLMATLTGLLVSTILYGTEYLLKLESFYGVKVLYIAPIILVTILMIKDSNILKGFDIRKIKIEEGDIKKNIKRIKWYHLIVLFIILIGGYVYITRSGNSGTVSNLEMQFRTTLERILKVRPRTKEFLIGYPALLIGLYMMKKNVRFAPHMMIIASIGTMSTVNTFTHLHTPLLNSLLRSFYGFFFGAIIGAMVIFLFNKTVAYFKEEV